MPLQINQFLPADCNNVVAQGYVARVHEISSTEYTNLVSQFFRSTSVNPVLVPASSLIVAPGSVDCTTNFVEFTYDPANTSDNSEVLVKVSNMPSPPMSSPPTGFYSIALFRGVISLFNPDGFHFSKGQNPGDPVTLTFYATINTGLPSQTTVYCGDLSGLIP